MFGTNVVFGVFGQQLGDTDMIIMIFHNL